MRHSEDRGPPLEPPKMERPRWWSNPGLRDPDAIIALVLAEPTTRDLAATMAHYGVDAVDDVRRRTEAERTGAQNRYLEKLYPPIREGVLDALGSAA
jgi:hypothetical protein